jgi:hypothetical protein
MLFKPYSIVNVHNDRPGNIILLYDQRNRLLHTYEQIFGKVATCETPLSSLPTKTTTTAFDSYYTSTS